LGQKTAKAQSSLPRGGNQYGGLTSHVTVSKNKRERTPLEEKKPEKAASGRNVNVFPKGGGGESKTQKKPLVSDHYDVDAKSALGGTSLGAKLDKKSSVKDQKRVAEANGGRP